MSKKTLSSLLLVVALSLPVPMSAVCSVNPNQENTEVSQQEAQTYVEDEVANAPEVNTAQANESTRKAIQAQKAKNAEENDKYGGAITIIAMSIVLCALIVLSILFLGFGRITSAIHTRKKREAHGVTAEEAEDHHEENDSGEVIAAISMALAEHQGQGHDIEDTILTIRRMRKAYSPWNSKIYNLRVVPELNNRDDAHHRKLK